MHSPSLARMLEASDHGEEDDDHDDNKHNYNDDDEDNEDAEDNDRDKTEERALLSLWERIKMRVRSMKGLGYGE